MTLQAYPIGVCKVCEKQFARVRSTQSVCGYRCANRLVKHQETAAKKAEQIVLARRKLAVKTIPQLIAEAQFAFNAWIRQRDIDQPCICCGKFTENEMIRGGIWDAGHYRSRGSAGHLRFYPDNCHRQLKRCNTYGAKDYRGGLIARIGLDRVEALEANNAVHKWCREELIAIKHDYRARLRELQKGAE